MWRSRRTTRTAVAILFLALSVSSAHSTSSKIAVDEQDGGYSGIVIKIADDGSVPEDKCQEILDNIRKLFEESSHALFEAIGGRVYIKSVSIVVPSTWRDGKCQRVINSPRVDTPYRNADIVVGGTHPVHGDSPYTQQSKGCGQPGDFMALPYEFLVRWNRTWETWGDPAKLFVHEWAKLRYGVFDEFGFNRDPLYPNYFKYNGQVLPTGTSDAPVSGYWIDEGGAPGCDPETESCYFRPSGSNDRVTCSLGYMHFLPSVKTFCGPGALYENVLAPTKHNVLCQGRSALDVILSHPDFVYRNPSERDNVEVDLKPEIKIVREPEPQYVLVIETSSSLDDYGQWKWINKATQKFIRYDLPLNSNLAIVTFSNTSKVQHPMVRVDSDDVRGRLADTIPDKYHLTRSDVKCLSCAVQKALHDVLRQDMAGAHIILITSGSGDTLSISDEQTIDEYVKYYHIKVSAILVPNDERLPMAFYDSVAQLSGGSSHVIRESRHRTVKTYVELLDSFRNLLFRDHRRPLSQVVHEKLVKMSDDSIGATTGKFNVDPNLGHNTKFGVYVEDAEDHLIKSVTFTDSRGNAYGPFTSMSSLYDIINLKVVNYPVGAAPPFDESDLLGTDWHYSMEWYSGSSHRQRSAIVITSEPSPADRDFPSRGIEIEVWTNSEVASDIITAQHPLAVFAKVSMRNGRNTPSPVLEAMVTVEVLVSTTNGTTEVHSMRLMDNGNGDPDLMSGDGIYSRYLAVYPNAGRYEFSVAVDDNRQRAYFVNSNAGRSRRAMPIVRDLSNNNSRRWMRNTVVRRCCGSRVFVPQGQRETTGQFKRAAAGPVIHLLQVPGSSLDLMPPSKVGDLRMRALEDGQTFLAVWTAPGDDYDHGSVTGYKFVYSSNISALLDADSEAETLLQFQRPDPAGVQTSYQFEFEHYNRDYFLGLVAFDERSNEGKLSNIVSVYVDSNDIAVLPEKGSSGSPLAAPAPGPSAADGDEGVMIGALFGAFVVIALLLWAGIWFHRNRVVPGNAAKTTKKSGVTANLVKPGDIDTSGSELEIRLSSPKRPDRAAPKIPQFSTLASGGAVYPDGKDQADENTPTYWSASELLEKHEQRTIYGETNGIAAHHTLVSPTTFHNAFPRPLDPIVEDPEFAIYNATSTPVVRNGGRLNGSAAGTAAAHNLTFPRRGTTTTASSPPTRPPPPHLTTDSLLVNTSLMFQADSGSVYGYARSEPPIYGSGRKVPPKVAPKPSVSGVLFPGNGGVGGGGGGGGDVIDILNLPKIDAKEAVRNITHV